MYFIFMSRSPPRVPVICIPEEPVLQLASSLRIGINETFSVLRDIVSGKDVKKFLSVCRFCSSRGAIAHYEIMLPLFAYVAPAFLLPSK